MAEAVKALDAVGERFGLRFDYRYADVGGCAIDRHGSALPPETLKICEQSDAILFGSVGGPKWESLPPERQPERAALLPLRKHFDLFCNLRPAKLSPRLAAQSPLRPEIVGRRLRRPLRPRADRRRLLRPAQGPGRFAARSNGRSTRWSTAARRSSGSRTPPSGSPPRAASRVTSVDKANILTTMVFWREVVCEVGQGYPGRRAGAPLRR